MYDVDMNGEVDFDEMEKLLSAIYTMVGLEKKDAEIAARDIFDTIDANRDGILTQDEFVAACRKRRELLEVLSPH